MPSRGSVQQPVRFFDLCVAAQEKRADHVISVRQGATGAASVEQSVGDMIQTATRVARALGEICEGRDVF